jgi:hypothetical protein
VIGPFDCAGHVAGANRLVGPDGIIAGKAGEPPGQEGLEDEMPAVLLADQDDEWGAVHPRRREGADGVPEAGGRV